MRNFTILKAALLSAFFFFLFSVNSFAQCTLFEDFEHEAWLQSGTGSYTARTVTDNVGEWTVAGVCISGDNSDRHHDLQSIRLRGNTTDGNCRVEMNFDKPNGIGIVSFFYASYSTHSGGIIVLYYSTNGGTSWTDAGSVTAPAWSGEMEQAAFPINIQGNVRIKIVREGSLASGTTVNIDDLCLTDFNEAGHTAAPVFNPPGGSYPEPINVTISSTTPDAIIRYTTDGTTPDESSTQYSTPIPVSTQTTLKAKAWAEDMDPSIVTTANYVFPQTVSTLAELRTLAPPYIEGANNGTTVYTYTGKAVVTQKKIATSNQAVTLYIQDATAAIMVYDAAKNLQADLEIGDKITKISGTLTNYWGMLEIIPNGECDVVDYYQQVPTTVVTASQLNTDNENPIQAKVITLKGVYYVQTGVFEKDKYYDITEDGTVYEAVVSVERLFDTDYINDPIPTTAVDIDGVCNFVREKNRIVPLDKSNDVIGPVNINTFNKSAIKLSPNPAHNFVNIVTGSSMKLEVYGLLGNCIAVENLNEGSNTISVSEYPAGMYLMKLIDNKTGQAYVQKLVVQ